MKKIVLACTIFLSATISLFAGDDKGKQKAMNAFRKEFSSAIEETWRESNDFFEIEFTSQGKRMFAYYTKGGYLMGTARNILSTELPDNLQIELKTAYSGYWITGLIEVTKDDGVSFYITLKNADEKIILESLNSGGWEVYNKI